VGRDPIKASMESHGDLSPMPFSGDGYQDGYSLYAGWFIPNRLDPDGLSACCCEDIEYSFEPRHWTAYEAKDGWRAGFLIKAKHIVKGDPKLCKYYQNETGTMTATLKDQKRPFNKIEGKHDDSNEIPWRPATNGYADTLGLVWPNLKKVLRIANPTVILKLDMIVSFKCVSSGGSSFTKTMKVSGETTASGNFDVKPKVDPGVLNLPPPYDPRR
jgi:hypothetical protein